ncbi:MAG: radical SAM protein [Nanoarchaeota archaeon]|nr:B12-binding domain-containing radical SAM protein [Nanoarchaeota archaeon]
MKITLVNPPVKKIIEFWDKPKYPQLSLGYLAGYLESKKIDCKIIDAKLEGSSHSNVIKRCIGEDIVGITSFTHDIHNSSQLAENIKKFSPNTKIVIGGIHATALPEETMTTFPIFDYLVYGEGEETLYELVEAIAGRKKFREVNGLVFRDKDKIIVNEPRKGIQNLDDLPLPAWHLFPKATEHFIITARGCPFNCNFCMRAHGQKPRVRSVDNVLKELEMLAHVYKTTYVYVADETFTLFKDRAKEICDEMIKRKLNNKFIWDAETRVNCINLEVLEKMKKAGCVLIKFGIESGNPKILKNSKKGITIEQVKKAVKLAKKAKLKTEGLFILGHPNETKKTMRDTVNLAIKLNTTKVAFGIMTPYPGTEIHEIVKRGEGRYKLLSLDWRDYNKQLGNALEFDDITRKEIEKIQFWGYMKFHIYNFKFKEIIKNFFENRNLTFAIMKKIIKIRS